MKICLVSRYFDFRNAGLGRVGLEIAKELRARGHEVVTVSTNGSSLYSYFFYTAVQIPLKLPEADVYHAITPMEAFWLPEDKSVVTFHDLFQITDPDKISSAMGGRGWKNFVGTKYFALMARLATRCAHLVAVSDKTKADMVKHLNVDASKVTVIRSGIREDLQPIGIGKDPSEFIVGYLGQLDRRKRVDLLIKAYRKSELPGELLIAGTGPEKESLVELAQGDSRISFLGHIRDEELTNFYNCLDVFVFPTWIEGYGLPIVEAMACKRPVVVLQDAIIPSEIKNRCVITDQLDYLLGNYTYLTTRCNSIHLESNYEFAKSHSWKIAVDQYMELYKEVA